MTLIEFRLLSESDQQEAIYKHGTYIGKRKHGRFPVLLYQLDSFYIEIYYICYRKTIDHMYSFSSTALIDPYLPQINIEILVS